MHSLSSQLLNQAAEWKLQAKVLKEQETVLQAQVKGGQQCMGCEAKLVCTRPHVWQGQGVQDLEMNPNFIFIILK